MRNKDTIISFLESYKLGNATVEPITSGISSITSLASHDAKKYILKIYNKDSNIETEVRFSHYLYSNKIPVAKIIQNSKSQLITDINDLRGVLFEFCSGEPVKWGDINTFFSEHLAETLAKMHSLMIGNTEIPGKDYCKSNIDSVSGVSNIKIIEKSKEISDSIKNLDFSCLKKGLIHADITRQNVLATKDRNDINAIIDFGDAHYDYFVWDLAVLITHIFITKTYGIDWKALDDFIKKYYELIPLTEKEVGAIIPFIKIRNLNLAIEVNRLSLKKEGNSDELISIEDSVMTKLDLVEKEQERLEKLLKGNG